MMPEQDPAILQQEARNFRDGFQSVLIATASLKGDPDISYAPFVLNETGAICIYVSQLARHTQNLLECPTASLMFIAGEQDSRNLFARRRLILQCRAEPVTGVEAEPVLQQMQTQLGKTVELLRSLPDFLLFRFEVENGSYIRGFGQAWSLVGNDLEVQGLRKT
jgi:putative heme iron utilization protein